MLCKPKEQRAQISNKSESKGISAKCITLSVLETSLPMQRGQDTLALDISA